MTVLQLQYAVECARRQSINKAAEALFVSPSNMSKAILSLETELGFPIFMRTPGGVRPTDKGEAFLQHARAIVGELGRIEKLRDDHNALRLYVVGIPFSPVNRAMDRMIRRHQEADNLDLRLEIDTTEHAVERLCAARDHLAVAAISAEAEIAFRAHLKKRQIAGRMLLRSPLCICLRKGHPIFEQAEPGSPGFWDALRRYPFLSDHGRERSFFPLVSNGAYNRLLSHCSRTVLVTDRGWKNELLQSTDCFTYGILPPSGGKDEGYVTIPTDLSSFLIMALWMDKGPMPPLASEYLACLEEEIDPAFAP